MVPTITAFSEKITRLGGTGIPPVAPMSKGAAAMRRAHHRRRKFWQFCWCHFWDGEHVTSSKVVGDLQIGDIKGQDLNHLE